MIEETFSDEQMQRSFFLKLCAEKNKRKTFIELQNSSAKEYPENNSSNRRSSLLSIIAIVAGIAGAYLMWNQYETFLKDNYDEQTQIFESVRFPAQQAVKQSAGIKQYVLPSSYQPIFPLRYSNKDLHDITFSKK